MYKRKLKLHQSWGKGLCGVSTLISPRRVYCVCIHEEQRTLWSGNAKGDISTWSFHSARPINHFKAHSAAVNCLQHLPSQKRVFSCSADSTIRIWSTKSMLHRRSSTSDILRTNYPSAKKKCNKRSPLQKSFGSRHSLSCAHTNLGDDDSAGVDVEDDSDDGEEEEGKTATARAWPRSKLDGLHTLRGHEDGVQMIQLSDTGDRLVSASLDATVKIWDLNTCQVIQTLRDSTEIKCMQYDGKKVITGCNDGTLKVWDAASGKKICRIRTSLEKAMCLHFDNQRNLLIVGGDAYRGASLHCGKHASMLRSSDGLHPPPPYLCSGIGKFSYPALLFSLRDMISMGRQHFHMLLGHRDRIWTLQFMDNYLVTGSRDTTVRVWPLDKAEREMGGTLGEKKPRHTNWVSSCSGDHYILGSKEEQHNNSIYWLEFNENRIVTGSADHTVKIWNFDTPRVGDFK